MFSPPAVEPIGLILYKLRWVFAYRIHHNHQGYPPIVETRYVRI